MCEDEVNPYQGCEEVFRIQPMANEVNLDANGVGGVGRDIRTLPQGTITVTPTSRNAANTEGSAPFVATGLAFDKDGDNCSLLIRREKRSGRRNSTATAI